ncbi:organic hydroperoxide resistance protein [Halalkalibacter akibai]|uniref:Organic hydroperoxide resistance protein n=1 Tax=Halalkalibacter akibai (strain ATCC 43226 / DSM 21942 / CIP 109018 / JCM 9157 / 1139) TaxID=1236973 RepID=W4QXU9_HALA3|nr:organic hydroperoxide resistance protein [Halalkalibacter akibai]GAE36747.1 organic hydroperoxide resistance protein [Halalkalibacter akibai JCM 9157]
MSDVLFTAQAKAIGGRNGQVTSDDGVLNHKLVMPKGTSADAEGTNPEQLFAAGYAACFDGALNLVASKEKKEVETEINAEVSLMKDPEDNGYKIGVVLHATVKGVSQEEAENLVHKAHQVCPYSKATKGNIDVKLNVISQ